MKRFFIVLACLFAATELGLVGCNAILGNESGILQSDASVGSEAAVCAANQKNCIDCVAIDDPNLGCGGACSVCATPPNAQAACALQNNVETCAMGKCNAQFADCDNDAGDGCETHATTRSHCGSCGQDCLQDFCEREPDGGYGCSTTCDTPNITCASDAGTECVDPNTDTANCGGCGHDCTVDNGLGGCNGGVCDIVCNSKYFLCGGECVAASEAQCGASCTSCTTGSHCDVNAGSASYGSCVTNSVVDAGVPGCTVTSDCPATQVCCTGTCTAETNGTCGALCQACGANQVCSAGSCACASSSKKCTSGGNSWCCGSTQQCGVTPGSCNNRQACAECTLANSTCGCGDQTSCAAPTANPNCGACGVDCRTMGQCCCPSAGVSGGATYSCVGTGTSTDDSGICACPL